MADDQTTTQQDTETSETTTETTQATDTAATETGVETETDDAAATVEDDGTTVLGRKDGETDGEKAEETVDELRGAPEAYDLKLEGVELDAAVVEEAAPILKELDLSNVAANKLLPVAKSLVDRTQNATLQALTDAAAQQRKDWLDIAKSDEEIGGPKWDETTALAAKGLDALGFVQGHPFRKALNETGFGNHRDMLFAFRKVGELVGEDGFVRSDANTTDNRDLADRMYGGGKK